MEKSKVLDLFRWYLANQADLVQKFEHRVLVISDDGVVGDYATEGEAYFDAIEKQMILGSFIIQECTEGEDAYSAHIYSPVTF